ncbi:MAG: hypothetical protein ABSB80_09105 [Methanoregula sp.]|jgi:hypothetical protein|uniref:hypothetical protein n=1 Tax=Methanoregula sp. TaxID=2052170 RepID=UPI003D12F8F1
MVTSEEIQKLKDELRGESEQVTRLYFEKIIDFLKWTTTISLGALLWIGTNYHSIGNSIWLNTSLASFGLSIMFSFVYVIFILNCVNKTSKLTIYHFDTVSSLIPGAPITDDVSKKIAEIGTRNSEKPKKISSFLGMLNCLIIFHGVCLIGGTLCFLLAMLFK